MPEGRPGRRMNSSFPGTPTFRNSVIVMVGNKLVINSNYHELFVMIPNP